MFRHKHYVPILKAKQSERWALRDLSASGRSLVTPLFEIPSVPKKSGVFTKTLQRHLDDTMQGIAADWGTSDRFFLDTKWLHSGHGAAAVNLACASARALGLQFIPVAHPNFDAATLGAIGGQCATDHRGVMVRVMRSRDLANPHSIVATLAATGVGIADADLLLDYHAGVMALPNDVPALPNLAQWRTFTCSSGVFPASTAALPAGVWSPVVRNCWNTWTVGLTAALPRKPSFGDFANRSPGAPGTGGNPPVVLRYTATTEWFVRADGTVHGGQSSNMHALCADLITQPFYSGPHFSIGDQQIEACSLRTQNPGGAREWLHWTINHHLELVAAAIAALP